MSKDNARISILSELMAFPTINQKDWLGSFDGKAQVGDLVSLCSAPASKWYLSWVREIKPAKHDTGYLLESIDDGELCWWSNVGLNVYDRERVKERPSWRWDDAQFAFSTRWRKVCKKYGAYIVLPCSPEFGDGNSVTLDVRIRHNFNDYSNPRTFPNWKKLTMKAMGEYYRECEKEYNKDKAQPA